jgi:hypothetical protein
MIFWFLGEYAVPGGVINTVHTTTPGVPPGSHPGCSNIRFMCRWKQHEQYRLLETLNWRAALRDGEQKGACCKINACWAVNRMSQKILTG